MIIGIDASTSCIGFCIMEDSGKLIDVDYIQFKKKISEYEKLTIFGQMMREQKKKHSGIDSVYVEKALQRSNNQNVVNILQRWNGMVCSELFHTFGTEPKLITQVEVLKAVGIKIPKGVKGKERKKYILQRVQECDTISIDKWKLKRTGNPKDYCFDMADAYIVAAAGLLEDERPK